MYLFDLYFCLDICPGVELLNHMVVLFLIFWETSILFSIVVPQLTFPPTVEEGSLLHTLSSFPLSPWCLASGSWGTVHLSSKPLTLYTSKMAWRRRHQGRGQHGSRGEQLVPPAHICALKGDPPRKVPGVQKEAVDQQRLRNGERRLKSWRLRGKWPEPQILVLETRL